MLFSGPHQRPRKGACGAPRVTPATPGCFLRHKCIMIDLIHTRRHETQTKN